MAPRRSRRARENSKKYTDDAFDGHQELQEILNITDRSSLPRNHREDVFPVDAPAAEDESLASQDESDASTSRSSLSQGDASVNILAQGQDGGLDAASDAASDETDGEARPKSDKTKATSVADGDDDSDSDYDSDLEKHSRAAIVPSSRPSRDPGQLFMLGDDLAEARVIIQAKSLFFDEVTLPCRLMPHDYKGIQPPSWAMHREQKPAEWANKITRLHQPVLLNKDQSSGYDTNRSSRAVSAGLPTSPTIQDMLPHSAIRMDDLMPMKPQENSTDTIRPAWLLNIGLPVQSLAWAPNVANGSHFLAVSTLSSKLPGPFTPCTGVPSSIEIWEFKAAQQPQADKAATIDMKAPPRRRLVLCGDFGPVLQIAWSPQTSYASTKGMFDLGILAAVSADGHLRTLSVSCSTKATREPTFMKIDDSCIDIAPTETLITCVVWLSETSLAAGCANGHVGVWDLEECMRTEDMRPLIWHGVSRTYISAIDTCLPSRPGILVTSSMDGHVRWLSLSNPTMDCVQSPRSRVGSCFSLWHDASQHLLYPEDLYSLRAISLRKAWSSSYICTLPAPAQSAAVSRQHSSTLIGCSDGTVQVLNPMRRIFARSFRNADYTQTWFTHDWRKGRAMAPDGDQLDYQNGLSRLTSGYSVEIAEEPENGRLFHKNKHGPKSQRESRVTGDGMLFATVHEYGTEIRALSWNPNASAQGWAAAGMEDGLLLVEDLCWD